MDYGGHSGMGNTNYYCDDVLKSLQIDVNSDYYRGGWGGILVNGKGPTNYDEATGDGYGGGGQGVTYDDEGLEGVILLEVQSV